MKFAVVVSTRGRPDGANAVLGAARLLASTKHEIRYIVAYDDDDETCLSYPFAAYVEKSVGPRPIGPGACWNRAFATSKMDVLVGFADDNLVVTPHWDDVIARHLEAVDPRIGVLSWHNNASPNQPTLMVAHREWIDRAGFFDGRFPFWFADTAIAETYSFVTGQLLPMPEALWVLGKYGESNPRLRDMRLWWAFYSATRRERLQTAARIREELGLPAPANLDQLVAAWQARDAEGLPLSEEIARGLPPREPDGHYLIARDAARYYLTSGQRICLSMIVKNEARVIRRCLDSVMPLIDCWSIVDTGSTDGTQAIIREHMRFLPGSLHERPWKDFAAKPFGGPGAGARKGRLHPDRRRRRHARDPARIRDAGARRRLLSLRHPARPPSLYTAATRQEHAAVALRGHPARVPDMPGFRQPRTPGAHRPLRQRWRATDQS
jgi:hypothetical protein